MSDDRNEGKARELRTSPGSKLIAAIGPDDPIWTDAGKWKLSNVIRFADYEAKPKPPAAEYALAPIVNLLARELSKPCAKLQDPDLPCDCGCSER